MRYKRGFPLFVAAVLFAGWVGPALATVPFAEDLSACKLPNGIATLPAPGSKAAEKGVLLKFATSGLIDFPSLMEGPAKVQQTLRTNKSADLLYLPDAGGTFWAVSGRIMDLGTSYLWQAGMSKLDVPMEIPTTSRGPAGTLPGIVEGRTYLVETTDERFALVRVLDKSDAAVVVQFIYQPESVLKFDVPKADPVDFRHPQPASTTPTVAPDIASNPTQPPAPPPILPPILPPVLPSALPPTASSATTPPTAPPIAPPAAAPATPDQVATLTPPAALPPLPPRPLTTLPAPAPRPSLGPNDRIEPGVIVLRSDSHGSAGSAGLEPSLDTFVRQRDQMIQRRMDIVSAPAHTPAEIEKKVQAINDLAYLHADQAADLLVSQISFLDARDTSKEFSPDLLLPCFAALKHLGKPATVAAMKGLKQLNFEDAGNGNDAPPYRADLLAGVIRTIEGDDVANFMFKREQEQTTDPKQRMVFGYVLSKN